MESFDDGKQNKSNSLPTLYWCVSMPMRTLKKSALNRASCRAVAPDSKRITGTREKKTNCVMQ